MYYVVMGIFFLKIIKIGNPLIYDIPFFVNLEKHSNNCFNDINNNSNLIQSVYGEKGNERIIKNFVNRFNDVVLRNNSSFDLYDSILKQPGFERITNVFCNSDILIRACQASNVKAVNWLLKMNMNTCVQDMNGVTALMYACQSQKLSNAVQSLAKDYKCLKLVDKNGQTSLFYAVNNINNFRILVDAGINVNSLNYDNDSILTYICKNGIYEPIKVLSIVEDLDLNTFNNDDKTAAMYLIEKAKYEELKQIINKDINFYYMNRNNESAMSILFKKYYEYYQKNEPKSEIPYLKVIKTLIQKEVDFNTSIDKQGNTPLMFFIMIEDWISLGYLFNKQNDSLNLSHQNCYGESAITLCLRLTKKKYEKVIKSNEISFCFPHSKLINYFIENKTYNINYIDKKGNNLLMYTIYYDSFEVFFLLIDKYYDIVDKNSKNLDNALIMCAKLSRGEIAREIIKRNLCDINKKDSNGNTAFHYAVQLNDYYMIDLLSYYNADPNIKNNQGVSPLELAINDKKMVKYISSPKPPYVILKILEGKDSFFKSKSKFNPS
eukprot:jgi/Orpsp1_1/1182413/evm.model.c7180000081176.1